MNKMKTPMNNNAPIVNVNFINPLICRINLSNSVIVIIYLLFKINITYKYSLCKLNSFMRTKTAEFYRKLEETGGYKIKTLMYPMDLATQSGHYVLIGINSVSGTSLRKNSKSVSDVDGFSSGVRVQTNNPINNREVFGDIDSRAQTKRIDSLIAIYMPDNLTSSQSTNWDEGEINAGRNLAYLANRANDSWRNFDASMLSDLVARSGNMFDLDAIGDGVLDLSLVGLGDSNELGRSAELLRREFRNPYIEMAFNNVSRRTFDLEFKFFPRNQQEAENVRNIITTLREASLPEITATGGILGSFFSYPSEFDISFMSYDHENKFIHKFSTSALTNMTVNYAAQGQTAFHKNIPGEGSPPVATSLSLSFMEMELMNADRAKQGY